MGGRGQLSRTRGSSGALSYKNMQGPQFSIGDGNLQDKYGVAKIRESRLAVDNRSGGYLSVKGRTMKIDQKRLAQNRARNRAIEREMQAEKRSRSRERDAWNIAWANMFK